MQVGCVLLHGSDHLHWVTPTPPSPSCPVTPQPPTPLIFPRGLVLLVLSLPIGPMILRLSEAVCVLPVPSLCVLRGQLCHMEFIRLTPFDHSVVPRPLLSAGCPGTFGHLCASAEVLIKGRRDAHVSCACACWMVPLCPLARSLSTPCPLCVHRESWGSASSYRPASCV